jgi:hypothetical protein
MKNKNVICLLAIMFCLFFFSCSTYHSAHNINRTRRGEKTGSWIEQDTADNSLSIIAINKYKHGIKHGKHIAWYASNGVICQKGHYKKGRRNGRWCFYFANGCGPNILRYTRTDTAVVRIINPRYL